MKLLFDFIPLILFFATFKWASSDPEHAAALATQYFGGAVAGGTVDAAQAPVVWATVVAMAATVAQVTYQVIAGKKVSVVLWLSLAIIFIMGGLTIWLNSEIFIKWKPTLLYAVFAAILLGGKVFWHKNFLRELLGKELVLPEAIWTRLLAAWIVFFVCVAVLNVVVAYSVSTPTWVNFKVFGLFGLTLLFTLGQGFYMSKYIVETPADEAQQVPKA